jgi:hypothetical protein
MRIDAFTASMRRQPPPDIETFTVGFEVEVLLPPLPGMEPPIDGMYDEAPPGFCRAVAAALRELTGDDYRAPLKPRPGRYGFQVLPEYDLDPLEFSEGCVGGVEIVTPPLPYPKAVDALVNLRQALWRLDAETHSNVGAHVGLSHPNCDLCYGLALQLDEEVILNAEKRACLPGLAPQEAAYMPQAIRRVRIDPDFSIGPRWIGHRIGHDKRYATNLAKLDRNYVELRHWSAEAALCNDMDPEDLIRPYQQACAMNATIMRDVLAQITDQAAAAAAWLDRMDDRLAVRFEDDPLGGARHGVRSAVIEIDGDGIGYFRETENEAALSLGEGPRNPSARLRRDLDMAEIRETLAHMILQEARHVWRYRFDEGVPDFVGQMLTCLDERDAFPKFAGLL